VLRCPGRLLPMVVVLGLVVTASVLSGPAKIQEGNYGLDTVGNAGSESSICRNWPGDPVLQLGWLPQLQEEALDGGHDSLAVDSLSPDFLARGNLPRGVRLALAGLEESGETVEATGSVAPTPAGTDNEIYNRRATGGDAADGDETREVIDEGLPYSADCGDTSICPTAVARYTADSGETFWLTTYTCEEGYCGLTASNLQVAPGIAACSEHWAFGTEFLIAGQWLVECQDRGSGVVLRNHLDVYFDTVQEAAAWLAQVGDHAKVRVMP